MRRRTHLAAAAKAETKSSLLKLEKRCLGISTLVKRMRRSMVLLEDAVAVPVGLEVSGDSLIHKHAEKGFGS